MSGDDVELWTAREAAEELGYSGPNAASVTRASLKRWGVPRVARRTSLGENLYEAAAVVRGATTRPDRGRPPGTWTAREAAEYLGYIGPNAAAAARAALARWGVPRLDRRTSRGENLYEAAAVRKGAGPRR